MQSVGCFCNVDDDDDDDGDGDGDDAGDGDDGDDGDDGGGDDDNNFFLVQALSLMNKTCRCIASSVSDLTNG